MQINLLSSHEQRHVIAHTLTLLFIGPVTLGDDHESSFSQSDALITAPGFIRIGNVIIPKQLQLKMATNEKYRPVIHLCV